MLVVLLTLAFTACRVDIDESAVPGSGEIFESASSDTAAEPPAVANDPGVTTGDSDSTGAMASGAEGAGELPALGPVPRRSHWHAAYIVRVCDQVLDPFESTDDPLGIHSHADGLMHIHPFSEAAGFENATLGVFADAMGFSISDGELVLPSGVTWRDGDVCDASQGRVFVDRWAGPGLEGPPERIFEGLDSIRFEADREVYQIAFAPVDSAPVVPPTMQQLENVSAPIVTDDVWVDIDPNLDLASVKLWTVDSVSEPPCADGTIAERTRTAESSCFVSIDQQFERSDAVTGARAVSFNRRAAVELTITDEFRLYLAQPLRSAENAVLAIEASGEVVYAVAYDSGTLDDNLLIIRGGLDVETARAMARLFAI